MLHASKQTDGSKGGASYLTSSVRASFVLSLVVLMTILLVLIKVRRGSHFTLPHPLCVTSRTPMNASK